MALPLVSFALLILPISPTLGDLVESQLNIIARFLNFNRTSPASSQTEGSIT